MNGSGGEGQQYAPSASNRALSFPLQGGEWRLLYLYRSLIPPQLDFRIGTGGQLHS